VTMDTKIKFEKKTRIIVKSIHSSLHSESNTIISYMEHRFKSIENIATKLQEKNC